MSERPQGVTTGRWDRWHPTDMAPWGKALWGTTVDYGQGAKLVIDRNGVGTYTDAAGETATWNPGLFGWQDEDGQFKDPTFGLSGMEWSAEELEAVVDELQQRADSIREEDPAAAQAFADRARELWDEAHDLDSEPYPY